MKVVDFNIINESMRRMIGNITKDLLKAMYGVDFKFDVDLANLSSLMREEEENLSFKIKGEPEQVKSYVKSVARTKFYLDAMMEFGKEHPMTIKKKEELDQAVSEFEEETGTTWPFKHEV